MPVRGWRCACRLPRSSCARPPDAKRPALARRPSSSAAIRRSLLRRPAVLLQALALGEHLGGAGEEADGGLHLLVGGGQDAAPRLLAEGAAHHLGADLEEHVVADV